MKVAKSEEKGRKKSLVVKRKLGIALMESVEEQLCSGGLDERGVMGYSAVKGGVIQFLVLCRSEQTVAQSGWYREGEASCRSMGGSGQRSCIRRGSSGKGDKKGLKDGRA